MWLKAATLKSAAVAVAVAVAVSVQHSLLAISTVVVLMSACSSPTTQTQPLDSVSKDTAPGLVNVDEACACCNWKIAQINEVDAIPVDDFKITGPVAIEFFTLAKRQDWFDSIDDGHQTYYRTIDQYGHYTAVIRPLLEQRGVKVVDTLISRTVLFFEDDKNEYIVDAGPYFHSDGVLMFTPGKAPIFWTAPVLSLSCPDSAFVKCYFGE